MNDFLHANSKYIAAIAIGLIAAAQALGWFGDIASPASWAQVVALITALLMPSAVTPPPPPLGPPNVPIKTPSP